MTAKIANWDEVQKFGSDVAESLTKSTSAFNFVEMAKEKFTAAGFKQIYEKDQWNISPGDKLFYTRNNSCIIAFTVGKKYTKETGVFKIIGAHTDSPSLRIAPNSYNPTSGLERYNVEKYGGGLWFTWFDRDLSVCGKVIYLDANKKLQSAIIKCDEPLFMIPNCPPHLKTDRDTLTWNIEAQMKPIIATTLVTQGLCDKEKCECKDKKLGCVLRGVILNELKKQNIQVEAGNIVDYDLVLYDTQPSRLIGVNKEFLSSGRLDNLGSSVPAVYAMCNIAKDEIVNEQESINMIALFDNEEIGSMTFQGCDSNFFYTHLKRIFTQVNKNGVTEDDWLRTCAKSFVISADLAHAFNPNFGEKFQYQHLNLTQQGVVIKINKNGRYASDSEGSSVMKEIAKKYNVPIQEFIVRQDSPCGTTIGPIITSKLGIRSVDVGIAQFAMHSIREQLGIYDLYYYRIFFEGFFKSYEEMVGNLFTK